MPANVTNHLLHYPIDLNLIGGCKFQCLFDSTLTHKLVLELFFRRLMCDGIRERPFEGCRETHVCERRRAQVFADAPDLSRDQFDFIAKS